MIVLIRKNAAYRLILAVNKIMRIKQFGDTHKHMPAFLSKKIFLFVILSFFAVSLLFNNTAQAECVPSANPMGCIPTDIGTDKSIEQILVDILNASLDLLFLIVLGFMVYGGYFWMTSMGNEEKVKKSKQILTASIIGLLIVLASLSITNFIVDAIGGTTITAPDGTNLTNRPFRDILSSVINAAVGLVGVISLATIVYGGFRWMTSAGKEETVSEAKRILTAGVIGVIIIAISWSVVYFVVNAVPG